VFQRYRDIQERRHSFDSAESGFTLIELLIVIVVLGILAAIVVFSLTGVSGQSKAAACTSDGKTVEIAADAYQAYTGNYPLAGATGITALVTGPPAYLHSWPAEQGITFSIGNSPDTILVDTGNGTPAAYTTACSGL